MNGKIAFAVFSVFAAAGAAPVAWAQGPDPATGTEVSQPSSGPHKRIEEMVITGSRISRDANLGSIQPVQTISGSAFQLQVGDVGQMLNNVPALLNSIAPIETADTGSAGISALNLRSLGAERTLTLVNGRRHVGGVAGAATVDVGSIPKSLIDRVDILSGGASAVYGADAVSGVVNFILKDDFDGFDFGMAGGKSTYGDQDVFETNATYGRNFAGGRGNVAITTDISRSESIRFGDRRTTRHNNMYSDQPNPALRFQRGDLGPRKDGVSLTPNFDQFFSVGSGRFPVGTRIPLSADGFIEDFSTEFGTAPTLTPAELKLMKRARKAPARVFLPGHTLPITANGGLISPLDPDAATAAGVSVDDCLQSFVGFNNLQSNTGDPLDRLGGCYFMGGDGRVKVFQDGLVSNNTNQFRGTGRTADFDDELLTPDDRRGAINLISRYELTENLTVFGEAKFAWANTRFGGPINSFYDLLAIRPDNAFIPDELRELATAANGLLVSRDPVDLGRNLDENRRRTYRVVGGIEGNFGNGWSYELSGNYGRFHRNQINHNEVLQDRWLAAIDVVEGPDGKPICRSELPGNALPPGSTTDIPVFDPGFFTFLPGRGKCVPANIFGTHSISPEAVAFITRTTESTVDLHQLVSTAILRGDTQAWFKLPGGAPAFAAGLEYRKERSRAEFDPLIRGILPIDGPSGQAGTYIGDIPGLRQKGLVFNPTSQLSNAGGSFDVKEAFAEVSLPVLRGAPGAEELTLTAAGRYSDYSTTGSAFTWNFGLSWAPLPDLRFRSTLAQAVRAPNVDELFSPEQGIGFSIVDPCDADELAALEGTSLGARRKANCAAGNVPEGFVNENTARIRGVSGGNTQLKEETARSFTVGLVLQPSFMPGFSMAVDYFDIDLEDAIETVSGQKIVDSCYDSGSIANQYCGLFTRNPITSNINFVRQTELNFAALKTRGVDFQVRYSFEWHENLLSFGIGGTHLQKLDEFFDPVDRSAVDPSLGEIGAPKWAGNFDFAWNRGPFTLAWNTEYLDQQSLVPLSEVNASYGGQGIEDDVLIHTVSLIWRVRDRYSVYATVNNLWNRKPFVGSVITPVDSVGRYISAGVRGHF